ncbi:MAG: hypothetical protein H7238_05535 [Polaromonas sp.]|nr:hypothetical protein [Polaromonas sp.]
MSADPAPDDPSHVEMVAEKLAVALKMPLRRIKRETPGEAAGGEDGLNLGRHRVRPGR